MPRTTPHSQPPPTPIQVRHRTTATEKAPVRGYPDKLFIYRLNASPYWWVRYWEKGKTFRKSTKTRCRLAATAFAKQFFSDIKHRIQHGPTAARTASAFDTVLKTLLASERAKLNRGELTKISYDNQVYRYDKKIRPFFQSVDVTDIDYAMVNEFLNEISTDDLSSSTISAYIRLVRKVLQHAARQRLIASVPELPAVSIKDNPRGWFTIREYRLLYRTAQQLTHRRYEIRKYRDGEGQTQTQYIDQASTAPRRGELMRHVDMTWDLRFLIVFMVNSYIRPTDIKFIQHRHVDVVDRDHRYLRLRIPPTKGHSDPITTMERAVGVYERICQHQQQTLGRCGPDDYVFLPQYGADQRDYALKQLQRQFDVLLEVSGLRTGVDGESRSLYSLRHTSIMYRLIFGESINTLVLARNARTSPEMIDRFYARPLSGEMNVDMLQSRRRRERTRPTHRDAGDGDER